MTDIREPEPTDLHAVFIRCNGRPECRDGLAIKTPISVDRLRDATGAADYVVIVTQPKGVAFTIVQIQCWKCFEALHPDDVPAYVEAMKSEKKSRIMS